MIPLLFHFLNVLTQDNSFLGDLYKHKCVKMYVNFISKKSKSGQEYAKSQEKSNLTPKRRWV